MLLPQNANKTIAINNGKRKHILKKIGFCFLNKISICKLIFFVRSSRSLKHFVRLKCGMVWVAKFLLLACCVLGRYVGNFAANKSYAN